MDLRQVPVHVEAQELQALPGIERSAQKMREDDTVQMLSIQFHRERCQHVGTGPKAGHPVRQRPAALGRRNRRCDFARLPGAVNNCFNRQAAIGICFR